MKIKTKFSLDRNLYGVNSGWGNGCYKPRTNEVDKIGKPVGIYFTRNGLFYAFNKIQGLWDEKDIFLTREEAEAEKARRDEALKV